MGDVAAWGPAHTAPSSRSAREFARSRGGTLPLSRQLRSTRGAILSSDGSGQVVTGA